MNSDLSIFNLAKDAFKRANRLFLLILCVILFSNMASLPARAKNITVGVYDNKPMIFMGKKGPEGVFIDVLAYIAEQENWSITYRYDKWEHVFDFVKDGKIDLLPGVAEKASRRTYLDYNRDVILSNWGVVYTRKNMKVNSILDLSNKRVGIQPNDTHGEYFSGLLGKMEIPFARVDAASYFDILKKLDTHYLDAGVVNFINSKVNAPQFDVQVTPIVFNPVEIRYAVPKGDPRGLLAALNTHVPALKADRASIYHHSMDKWFGVAVKDKYGIPGWLKWGGVITAAVFFILVARTQVLGGHVRAKNKALVAELDKRKQAEEEKELLLTAIEQSQDTVVITDARGAIQYANSAFEHLTGYSRETMIGQNLSMLKSGEHDLGFYKQMWETLSSGETWTGNLINRKKMGRFFTEEATISPVHDDFGAIVNYVAVKRDISDELELKNRLIQAQKMETIGTLAGGIAHDFNNILFPILGHAEILKEDIPRKEKGIHDSLNQIYAGGLRAKSLVNQILTFARQEDTEYRPLKVQLIVKEVIKFLRSTIPKTIDIRQYVDPNCRAVCADATQIHQIIMNLTTNACHAMGYDTGELKIELCEVEISQDESVYLGIGAGSYARLVVGDTGPGIPPDVLGKIFDPFFTTKEKGKGTGMGLSVVHGIIDKMKGCIKVQSEPGRGAEFKIYFPLDTTIEDDENSSSSDRPLPRGTETVLLVDDEEAILGMEKQALEKLGYQVISCISPLDALNIFGRAPGDVDLVLTDMSMPGMSGDKLAAALLDIRPDIPIIICTGFSEHLTPETLSLLGIKDVVLKPVILKTLSETIRVTLNSE